jgi:hypothetical protein
LAVPGRLTGIKVVELGVWVKHPPFERDNRSRRSIVLDTVSFDLDTLLLTGQQVCERAARVDGQSVREQPRRW